MSQPIRIISLMRGQVYVAATKPLEAQGLVTMLSQSGYTVVSVDALSDIENWMSAVVALNPNHTYQDNISTLYADIEAHREFDPATMDTFLVWLNLQQDPHIDSLAAKEVMGWIEKGYANLRYWSRPDGKELRKESWSPSTNMNDAFKLTEVIANLQFCVIIDVDTDYTLVTISDKESSLTVHTEQSVSANRAITLACIAAARHRKMEKSSSGN